MWTCSFFIMKFKLEGEGREIRIKEVKLKEKELNRSIGQCNGFFLKVRTKKVIIIWISLVRFSTVIVLL